MIFIVSLCPAKVDDSACSARKRYAPNARTAKSRDGKTHCQLDF